MIIKKGEHLKQRYFKLILLIHLVFEACVASAVAQYSEISDSSMPNNIQNLQIRDENIQALQLKILRNIQNQVDLLKENLVDIITTEEVINDDSFQTYDVKGKPIEQIISTISEYRISFQKETTSTSSNCIVVAKILNPAEPPFILQEDRKILSIKRSDLTKYGRPQTLHGQGQTLTDPLSHFLFDVARNSFIELIIPFDRQYEKCFDYKLLGVTKIKERTLYVVSVKGKESSIEEGITQKFIATEEDMVVKRDKTTNTMNTKGDLIATGEITATGKNKELFRRETDVSWDIKFGGLALIDTGTMEFFQFKNGLVNIQTIYAGSGTDYGKIDITPIRFPDGNRFSIFTDQGNIIAMADGSISCKPNNIFCSRYFLVQTEYEKVKIKDQFLTVPVARTIELYRRKLNLEALKLQKVEYKYEADLIETYKTSYSNYKAFNVDTNIKFGRIEGE